MIGRGVLLDIACFRGVKWMQDGESISNEELDKCAKQQNVEIRKGDFVIVCTGQMERCLEEGEWGGYAGGDAPGVKFENCYWCQASTSSRLHRHLGRRSAAERDHRGEPAVALGGYPGHGPVHG